MNNREFERIKRMAEQAKAAKEAEAKAKAEAEAKAAREAEENLHREVADFREDLLAGNLEKYGFALDDSPIGADFHRGNMVVRYYGNQLTSIEVDGVDIQKILGFDYEPYVDLCSYIPDRAVAWFKKLVQE